MATKLSTPARNDYSRLFLFRDGIFKNKPAEYMACVGMDGLSQDRGDVTPVECPSPYEYGAFIEVSQIPGELSRMTTTVTGQMSQKDNDIFYDLFIRNCPFDMHLHLGSCTQPDAFNQYDKALVFEGVLATSFSTDPLVALASGDRAVITNSMDISIGKYYNVLNPRYTVAASTLTVNGAIVASSVCDQRSCGECNDPSNGCEKLIAVSDDGYIYWSRDGGSNWDSFLITDGAATPASPTTVVDAVCFNSNYVVVDSNGDVWLGSLADIFNGDEPDFLMIDSGAVGTLAKIDAARDMAILVGSAGTIIALTGTRTFTKVGTGVTANGLTAVHVSPDGTIVVGGASGTVLYSNDGELWYTAQSAPSANNITSIVAKSERNWIVGTNVGGLWATEDAGRSWFAISYALGATDPVKDLQLATTHVIYLAAGELVYRSIDGGASWSAEPNSQLNFPTNGGVNTIATCTFDPNFALVGGESSGGAGILVQGSV
ncbi:MAG: hypothetical protein KDH96_00815 [Candidatus Riesia sp.]|nr:hypothetical protein [Candidatus Riesia sp.]